MREFDCRELELEEEEKTISAESKQKGKKSKKKEIVKLRDFEINQPDYAN